MSEPIRDLDDVEAQAWVLALANSDCSTMAADECIRLLRERREKNAPRGVALDIGSSYDAARHAERKAIVAWLTNESHHCLPSEHREAIVLLEAAMSIERGEHDR